MIGMKERRRKVEKRRKRGKIEGKEDEEVVEEKGERDWKNR